MILRTLGGVVALTVGVLLSPFTADAQPSAKVPKIGSLSPRTPSPTLEVFRQGLRERGHVDGQNVQIEVRYAGGNVWRLPQLAKELALFSYGVNVPAIARRAAGYVARIRKGEKPSNLPVQEPTKLELVINAKTAAALGLTIPQRVVLRAAQIIQ